MRHEVGDIGVLTCTGSIVGSERVVCGACTVVSERGRVGLSMSYTDMLTLTIINTTSIPARLARSVDDDYPHHIIQRALDACVVLAGGFVGTFYGVGRPVCPVDVVKVLSQTEWMIQIFTHNTTVTTCDFHKEGENKGKIGDQYFI